MLKRWFTLLMIAMLPILAKAQSGTVYPIDLSVMMTPPYATCLKEYVGSDRIVIQALLKDFSKSSDQFVIQLKVTDNRNRVVFMSWFGDYQFKPGETFTFPMGPNATPAQKSNVLHDLFDPSHASVKLRNECFDEGAYTFTFQAFERASYPSRKIALSLPFSYPVFLQGNTVQPLQIYPYENDVICNHYYSYTVENDVQKIATQLGGIAYQWQSANPTGMRVGYHLQVVDLGEIGDKKKEAIESEANSAFGNSSPLIVNQRVFTPFYNDQFDGTRYLEQHAYAWRVMAVTGDALDNELSFTDKKAPVRIFYFCGAPGIEEDTFKVILDERKMDDKLETVKMDTIKTGDLSALAMWRDSAIKKDYCGVNVEIRSYGQEKWTPFFVERSEALDAEGKATDNSYKFTENLSYNTRYEVRAQYVKCDGNCQDRTSCVYAPYSEIKEFVIPSPVDSATCGSNIPELTSCGDGVKVPKVFAGDTIIANGTRIVVDEVSYPNQGDSSIISGKAHVSFPIIKNIQLKMEFDNIQINCAKELVKGKIKSIWDEQTCAMINLEELTGQGSTGGNDNASSDAATEEYNEETAKSKDAGTLMVDADGNVKFKTKEGDIVDIGKSVELSAKDYQSKNYLSENSHYIEFYSTDKENNAFDNDSEGWYRKMSKYEYFDAPNNKVVLAWLANNPGKIKNIKAREVKKKQTIPSFDSVMFVIPSGGNYIQLDVKKEVVKKDSGNDTIYDLKIPGWADVTHSTPIFAIARKSDTSSFYDAGKMMVANYAERTHKLNIVSLVGELDKSYKTEAEKALNSIYGKLGVTYEVNFSIFENETIKDILSDGLSIGADDESRWKVETSEMKAIRYIYSQEKSFDKKAAYFFVVNHPQEEEYRHTVEGNMPRTQSVGYLFKDNINENLGRLIAHETGHGVYKFQHTFDYKDLPEGTTDNLMDYNGGDYLAHYQWKIMQDSVMFVWNVLQDDEDGFYKKWMNLQGTSSIYVESLKGYCNTEKACFLTPGGYIVQIPVDGLENLYFTSGFLSQFTYEGITYYAVFNKKSANYYSDAFYNYAPPYVVFDTDHHYVMKEVSTGKTFLYETQLDGFISSEDMIYKTDNLYFAVPASKNDCGSVVLYKTNYQRDPESKFSFDLELLISGGQKISTLSDPINCLLPSEKRFYLYVKEKLNLSYEQSNLLKEILKDKVNEVTVISEEFSNSIKYRNSKGESYSSEELLQDIQKLLSEYNDYLSPLYVFMTDITDYKDEHEVEYDDSYVSLTSGKGMLLYKRLYLYAQKNDRLDDLGKLCDYLSEKLRDIESYAFYFNEANSDVSYGITTLLSNYCHKNDIYSIADFESHFKKPIEADGVTVFSIVDLHYKLDTDNYNRSSIDYCKAEWEKTYDENGNLHRTLMTRPRYEYNPEDLVHRYRYLKGGGSIASAILNFENKGCAQPIAERTGYEQYGCEFGTTAATFAWAQYFATASEDVVKAYTLYRTVAVLSMSEVSVILNSFSNQAKKDFVKGAVIEALIYKLTFEVTESLFETQESFPWKDFVSDVAIAGAQSACHLSKTGEIAANCASGINTDDFIDFILKDNKDASWLDFPADCITNVLLSEAGAKVVEKVKKKFGVQVKTNIVPFLRKYNNVLQEKLFNSTAFKRLLNLNDEDAKLLSQLYRKESNLNLIEELLNSGFSINFLNAKSIDYLSSFSEQERKYIFEVFTEQFLKKGKNVSQNKFIELTKLLHDTKLTSSTKFSAQWDKTAYDNFYKAYENLLKQEKFAKWFPESNANSISEMHQMFCKAYNDNSVTVILYDGKSNEYLEVGIEIIGNGLFNFISKIVTGVPVDYNALN